jgi:hypothetical protein
MKSYTDLEQSKKLIEILPLESADMKWYFWKSEIDAPKLPTFGYSKDAAENYKSTEAVYLPCWSLAALLSVLPNGIVMNKDSQNGRYHFSSTYIGTYVTADNPVDACYDVVLKLHEINVL